jgi:hypothetical protein
MKQTRYITTTIQAGNRLEIDLPNLPIPQSGGYANGQTISQARGYANEVILIIPDAPESNLQLIDRRSFLKLSNLETRGFANEERRRILEQQAESALPYYEENKAEWEEWINLNIAETYAP